MDPSYYQFIDEMDDEMEIDEREFLHSLSKFYVVQMQLMVLVFMLLNALSSIYFREFSVLNPLCMFIAIHVGLALTTRVPDRRLYDQATSILVIWASIAMLLQTTITRNEAFGLIAMIFSASCCLFILSVLTLVILAAILM